MAYRDYQARLGTCHDRLKQKLLDNLISHEGSPTDCIRVRYIKDKPGDILSHEIIKADVIQVIFPPLIDIPYRTLSEDGTGWKINSLVTAHNDDFTDKYQIVTPHQDSVIVGDLLFRVFLDNSTSLPVVLGLEVVESLATIGQNSIISHKFNCAIHAEELPDDIIKVIVNFAKRRRIIGF